MKKLISLFLSLFFLSGCVPKYVEPSSSEPIASIRFEKSSKDPILGSSTFFISLDESYECIPGKGFIGQKIMATIDKGNPLVKDTSNRVISIPTKSNFRLLVVNAAGLSTCDVVLGFKPEQGKKYLVLSKSDLKSSEISCSAEITEISSNEKIDVNLTEYKQCNID